MLPFEGGVRRVGYAGKGFAFDNEQPCHEVLLAPYRLANRLVSAGEYLDFMEDGAYDDPLLWLSDGWDWLKKTGVRAPLYWARLPEGGYEVMTLHGRVQLDLHRPVCHVNYYEATRSLGGWVSVCRRSLSGKWRRPSSIHRAISWKRGFTSLSPLPPRKRSLARPSGIVGNGPRALMFPTLAFVRSLERLASTTASLW